MHKKGSYDLEDIAAEAVKSILKFAGVHLLARPADEDESSDQIESVGFSAVRQDVPAELTECLGFSCPMSSGICDICKLSLVPREVSIEISMMFSVEPKPPIKPVFQSWHDARHDLYSSATTSRGGRALAELHILERMRF